MALWCHGGGAWHNGLFLTTAYNINCQADIANHVAPLLQAGDTENFECHISGLAMGCFLVYSCPIIIDMTSEIATYNTYEVLVNEILGTFSIYAV